MPKLVDYAARFAFLREACFTLVANGGVHALSRPRVAQVLGTSPSTIRRLLDAEASLAELATGEVERRRRRARFRRARRDPAPGGALFDLVPDDTQLATELVAMRLRTEARPLVSPSPADPTEGWATASLAERFQIADRGYVHCPTAEADVEHDHALTEQVRQWDSEQDAIIARALDDLGVEEDRDAERALASAVVDGLTLARCTNGLPSEVARRALGLYLDRLGHRGDATARARVTG